MRSESQKRRNIRAVRCVRNRKGRTLMLMPKHQYCSTTERPGEFLSYPRLNIMDEMHGAFKQIAPCTRCVAIDERAQCQINRVDFNSAAHLAK